MIKIHAFFLGLGFFCCYTPALSLTQEVAMKRCEAHIDFLKKALLAFSDKEVEVTFQKIILNLEVALSVLKKSQDIKEIYLSRQSCDNGFKAAQWIVENFSTTSPPSREPPKPEVSQSIPEKKENNNDDDPSRSKDTIPKTSASPSKSA